MWYQDFIRKEMQRQGLSPYKLDVIIHSNGNSTVKNFLTYSGERIRLRTLERILDVLGYELVAVKKGTDTVVSRGERTIPHA
jgi:hypothetical protein